MCDVKDDNKDDAQDEANYNFKDEGLEHDTDIDGLAGKDDTKDKALELEFLPGTIRDYGAEARDQIAKGKMNDFSAVENGIKEWSNNIDSTKKDIAEINERLKQLKADILDQCVDEDLEFNSIVNNSLDKIYKVNINEGIKCSLASYIWREPSRDTSLKCVFCKKKGDTMVCNEAACKMSYQLNCRVPSDCMMQYFGQLSPCCRLRGGVLCSMRTGGQPSHCTICLSELAVSWPHDLALETQLSTVEARGLSLAHDPGGLSELSLSLPQDSSLDVQFWSGPGQREGSGKEIYRKFTVNETPTEPDPKIQTCMASLTCSNVMMSERISSDPPYSGGRVDAGGREAGLYVVSKEALSRKSQEIDTDSQFAWDSEVDTTMR